MVNNKKHVKPLEVPDIKEILYSGTFLLKQYFYPIELTGLYYWMYLTSQRISEALATQVRHIKFRKVVYKGKKRVIVLVSSINKKAKKLNLKVKDIPIVLDLYHFEEKEMFMFIYKHLIKPRKEKGEYDAFLFKNLLKYAPENINYRFKRNLPFFSLRCVLPNGEIVNDYKYHQHPHFLRHTRLTHLSEKENLDVLELMKIAGWTTPDMATTYVKTGLNKIIEKIMSDKNDKFI